MSDDPKSNLIFRIGLGILLLSNIILLPILNFQGVLKFHLNFLFISLGALLTGLGIRFDEDSESKVISRVILIGFFFLFLVGIGADIPVYVILGLFRLRIDNTLTSFIFLLAGYGISSLINVRVAQITPAPIIIPRHGTDVDSEDVEIVEEIQPKLVFLSYSSNNQDNVNRLYDELQKGDYKPWMASKDVKVGQEYSLQILEAIDDCDFFLLVISSESTASLHVKTELERAFSKNRKIIPILTDDIEIPKAWEYFLSTFQWIEVFGKSDKKWIPELITELDTR